MALKPRPDSLQKRELRHVVEVIVSIGIAVVVAALIRHFLFNIYVVPSESMDPNIQIGDRIVTQMWVPEVGGVHRGDVIVFADPGGWLPQDITDDSSTGSNFDALSFFALAPDSGADLVKRVIGIGGDRVVGSADGSLTVNGEPVVEPWAVDSGQEPFEVAVPSGHLWVQGDNRGMSADSRFQPVPFVPLENVVGRATGVIWPLNHLHLL